MELVGEYKRRPDWLVAKAERRARPSVMGVCCHHGRLPREGGRTTNLPPATTRSSNHDAASRPKMAASQPPHSQQNATWRRRPPTKICARPRPPGQCCGSFRRGNFPLGVVSESEREGLIEAPAAEQNTTRRGALWSSRGRGRGGPAVWGHEGLGAVGGGRGLVVCRKASEGAVMWQITMPPPGGSCESTTTLHRRQQQHRAARLGIWGQAACGRAGPWVAWGRLD